MRQPFSLTSKLFITLVLTAILIGAAGLKTYEYFSYEVQRDKLSVRIATASVRISKALIKPARNADIAGVRQILSAFAASPEISCVKLELAIFDVAEYWPYQGCEADNVDAMIHRQPVRQAMRRFGHAEIYFTDSGIEEEIRSVFFMVAIGIAALMASQLLVIFFINKHLIAGPILAITTVLARLGQGDKQARIEAINSSSEFSTLAQSYNDMAQELAAQEQLQRQYIEKIDQQNTEISQSLNYAAAIQNGLSGLDQGFADSVFEIAIEQKQLVQIGGDYCVGLDLGKQYLVFFADATGHGVPGALATMLLASAVRIVAGSANPPDLPEDWLVAIHKNFRDSLTRQIPRTDIAQLGADAALLLLDKQNKTLRLASAKTPVFTVSGQEVTIVNGDKISLGYDAKTIRTTTKTFTLENMDDRLVLCTDGIFDQPDEIRNFGYGKRRLARFLSGIEDKTLSAGQLAKMIFEDVRHYAGGAGQVDDCTILVIQHRR